MLFTTVDYLASVTRLWLIGVVRSSGFSTKIDKVSKYHNKLTVLLLLPCLLILNNNLNPGCNGTLDTSVSPPVVRFTFPINLTNACGSSFKTVSAAGTDLFSDFSNIQTVSVCGMVKSFDPTTGTVTYNTELKYYYSCSYPLEYILNNTEVDVTGQSIAATLNNGSFLSTLSMKLFSDTTYTTPLLMPSTGILMRTNVYVEVKATNLTTQYNVLLDRCYASISALPSNSTYFNLFVPCTNDRMTTMLVNGMNQSARFYFPAFRFLEQQNQSVSTYYLHCITRLCEPNSCAAFKQCSGTRRKRAADGTDDTSVTKPYTISSPAIVTQADTPLSNQNLKNAENNAGTTTKLGVSVGILAVACENYVVQITKYEIWAKPALVKYISTTDLSDTQ
uniref:ZP domain-containing protein n=1 Tax=Monopterus albus TaxID=43700 RepID=A0A3Q3K352_MONAL